MKLGKPKKVPAKIIKFLYMSYKWGYSDKEKGLKLKSEEEIKKSINRGYEQSNNKKQ